MWHYGHIAAIGMGLVGCFKPALDREVSDTEPSGEVDAEVEADARDGDEVELPCGEVGAQCDDGDPCTLDDRCTDAGCAGVARECPPLTCRAPGVCSPVDGECTYTEALDGTSCDDGDRCTTGDRCIDGACKPLRPADDSRFDFAVWYDGMGGNRVSGMTEIEGKVAVLVEFPVEEGVENPTLSVGGSSSGGGFNLGLPSGARFGLAVVWHGQRGIPDRAEVVAWSESPLRGRSIAAWRDSALVVGTFEGEMEIGGLAFRTSDGFEGPALFASTLDSGDADPWILENESLVGYRQQDDFVVADGRCAILVGVQGGRHATLIRRGQDLARFDSGGSALASSHIGVLPRCLDAVTAKIELRSSANGFVAITHAAPSGDLIALAGISTGPVVMDNGDSEQPLLVADEAQSLFLQLDGDKLEVLATVTDPLGGLDSSLPHGLGAAGGKVAFARDVWGQAEIATSMGQMPALDNPASSSDGYPRALGIVVGLPTEPVFQFAELSGKIPLFQRILPGPDHTMTVGWSNNANPGPKRVGLVAASYGRSGRVWQHNICQSDGSAEVGDEQQRSFAAQVPGTSGVYVAGTLLGGCTLGGANRVTVPARQSVGFFTRINSENGIGCE